jgi:hypothetical protein
MLSGALWAKIDHYGELSRTPTLSGLPSKETETKQAQNLAPRRRCTFTMCRKLPIFF